MLRFRPIGYEQRKSIRRNTERAKKAKLQKKRENAKTFEIRNYYKLPKVVKKLLPMFRIKSGVEVVPFKPYDYQELLLKIIDDHPTIIILKDRQIGITEVIGARILYKSLMNSAYSAAIISLTQELSKNVSKRVKLMASALKIKWDTDATTEKVIEHGGTSYYLPNTPNAARGLQSVAELFLDECAFYKEFEELYTAASSTQEAVPLEHRKTVLNSTVPSEGMLSTHWKMLDSDNPEGINAYECVKKARLGGTNCDIPGMFWWVDEDGIAKVIISHKAHPKYGSDPDYLKKTWKRRKAPWSIILREHNLGLEQASGSLFDIDAVKAAMTGAWTIPTRDRTYMICTDPNFGGSDQWVTQVWDVTDDIKILVAEYAEANRSTTYSKSKTLKLIDEYDPCLYAVESNGGGTVIAENISNLRPSLRVEVTTTTNSTKVKNTDRVAFLFEDKKLVVPADWKEGLGECRAFSCVEREATGGAYDDRVTCMAAGFAWLQECSSTDADTPATTKPKEEYGKSSGTRKAGKRKARRF